MARITVEDCILNVPDRFELVILAAQRTRNISSGAALVVERDNDKNPVVSLREIAGDGSLLEGLREAVLGNFQRYIEKVDSSSELSEFLYEEKKSWISQATLEEDCSPKMSFQDESCSDDFISEEY